MVTIGGGWIGLEIAAAAKERGGEVTVVEQADVPLAGPLGPEVAQVFVDLHREKGVTLRTGIGVEEIVVDDGTATGVRLAGGERIDADVVLVAAGAIPNLELAESADVKTDGGGVLVDAGMRSSDPDIFVVGDIANAEHPVLGHRVRNEHWANALNQPKVAPPICSAATPNSLARLRIACPGRHAGQHLGSTRRRGGTHQVRGGGRRVETRRPRRRVGRPARYLTSVRSIRNTPKLNGASRRYRLSALLGTMVVRSGKGREVPSLNIEFTDEEHAGIKAAAEREGVSLKPFVHDAAVERASDHRRRVLDAARRSAAWSAELNDRLK